MNFVDRLEKKYRISYTNQIQASVQSNFREKIEAKYKIVENIKKIAAKVLKAILPTLFLFPASGFAKIKDPNELGKKFQQISTQVAGQAEVQTHILQNDPDQPQIVVYTLKVDRGSSTNPSTATIKYIEGKGATAKTPSYQGKDDEASMLADEFKTILSAMDSQAKKQQQQQQVVQK